MQNGFRALKEIRPTSPVAERLSKELKVHGFKFVGPTIVYAFMQAVGMVNDHLVDCFRYAPVAKMGARKHRW